jgi:hypothetical protein
MVVLLPFAGIVDQTTHGTRLVPCHLVMRESARADSSRRRAQLPFDQLVMPQIDAPLNP